MTMCVATGCGAPQLVGRGCQAIRQSPEPPNRYAVLRPPDLLNEPTDAHAQMTLLDCAFTTVPGSGDMHLPDQGSGQRCAGARGAKNGPPGQRESRVPRFGTAQLVSWAFAGKRCIGVLERVGIGDVGRTLHHHDNEGRNGYGEHGSPVQQKQADAEDIDI